MNFNDAFAYVVGEEGVLSTDYDDRGNWTGGEIGQGELRGTKYGISAAEYPTLDIPNLTLDQARAICKARYWDPLSGDLLPYCIALCLLDFGYNAGVPEAIRVAQRALNVQTDGELGPKTLTALNLVSPTKFIPTFTSYRIAAYHQMPEWEKYGPQWTARAEKTMTEALACLQ